MVAIRNKELIHCTTPTDYLLVSTVSNWGGYALVASLIAHSYYLHEVSELKKVRNVSSGEKEGETDGTCMDMGSKTSIRIEDYTEKLLVSNEEEYAICKAIVDAGARDGISGELKPEVDGMDFNITLSVLDGLRKILYDEFN